MIAALNWRRGERSLSGHEEHAEQVSTATVPALEVQQLKEALEAEKEKSR